MIFNLFYTYFISLHIHDFSLLKRSNSDKSLNEVISPIEMFSQKFEGLNMSSFII